MVAFAGYVPVRLFVDNWLRRRYETPLSATWPNTPRYTGPDLFHSWVLSEEPTNRLGHVVNLPFGLLATCSRAISSTVRNINPECLAQPGAGFNHAVYQPASRFWTFQGIETGLYCGTALVLILVAAWWTHQRTA
jgi:hypothetical protein